MCGLVAPDTVHAGRPVGLVGRYRADSKASGAAMLSAACRLLAGRGCKLAVGPMDGSTWRRYRLVTETGSRLPFFLEPDNPPEWPAHFAAAGFVPLARYDSAMTSSLDGLAVTPGRPPPGESPCGPSTWTITSPKCGGSTV